MRPGQGEGSGFHLYCIVPAAHEPGSGLQGVEGKEVRLADMGEVGVWVSPSSGPPAASIDAVRAHDGVIRAAMTSTVTPIPVRFGQWVEGVAELRALVEESGPFYGEALADVAGALEIGLRLRSLEDGPGDASERADDGDAADGIDDRASFSGGAGRGRAHMERLSRKRRADRALEDRADALAETLRERLGGLLRADRVPSPDVERDTALICHLVERSRFEAYRREIDDFAAETPDLEVVVTGPWPPYSFAP